MTSDVSDRKNTLRTRLRAARRSGVVPSMAAEVLLAVDAFALSPGQTVCAYVASAHEPGSLEMVEVLRSHGLRVLLPVDRKSTRLNSSHLVISYAVFCVKQ